MGMDVYGKAATSEAGEYFRRNVWGWRPLWTYIEEQHGDLARSVEYGYSNDGDGLEAEDSIELARRLRDDLLDGTTEEYVLARNLLLSAMPDIPCEICDGSGQRPDGLHDVEWKQAGCNGCGGTGTTRPWDTWYDLEVDDIREFADFLESCGGFAIC